MNENMLEEGDKYLQYELQVSYGRKVAFQIVFTALCIFLIYGNSFDCSWHLDDTPNITNNPSLHLKTISLENIKRTLSPDQRLLYRPVACLSFAINYYFNELNVCGYHFVNIIIHIVSSIILFLFILNTLNLPEIKKRYESTSYSIALLASFLWAINPIHTQAVTYIVQRMASLAGMFYILTMYLYLKARTAEKSFVKYMFSMLCIISFLMAFGSKENAAMLILAVIFYETIILRWSGEKPLLRIKPLIYFFCVILAGLLLYFILGKMDLFSLMGGYHIRPYNMFQRFLTEFRVVIYYLSLIFYPIPQRLSIAHSISVSNSLFDPIGTLFSVLIIGITILLLIIGARRYPVISYSILFFFLNHLIESTILPLELIFEHRNYIPSMMIFVPVSILILKIFERASNSKWKKFFISIAIITILFSLGNATFIRNYAWKTPETLWLDALKKAPEQFRVYNCLAIYYQNEGYFDKAIDEYRKALKSPGIQRKDDPAKAYYNLGLLYNELMDFKKAEYYFNKALQVKPGYSKILGNLAAVYEKQGNLELANEYLIKAFKKEPGNPNYNLNMGLYHLRGGRPDIAIRHLLISKHDKMLERKSLLYLGLAYKLKGMFGRSATYFKAAAEIDTRDITPHLFLAEIYFITGHEKKADKKAKYIMNILRKNKVIFDNVIDYLSRDGTSNNIRPSQKIIIPLLIKFSDPDEKEELLKIAI